MEVDLTKCRWIVFDAVGTLIHPNPSVSIAYHLIGTRHGSKLSVQEISQRFRHAFRRSEVMVYETTRADRVFQSNHEVELARWRWIVSEVLSDVRDQESCFVDLWDHFAQPTSWSCFDDVGPTLSALAKAGLRLAIASNFDARLHPVCDALEPLRPIERRFVSSETGYRKPAPEFYAHVVTTCGCPATEILMIGDDHQHDVTAPRTCGMQAILLDRSRSQTVEQSLTSLTELAVIHGNTAFLAGQLL